MSTRASLVSGSKLPTLLTGGSFEKLWRAPNGPAMFTTAFSKRRYLKACGGSLKSVVGPYILMPTPGSSCVGRSCPARRVSTLRAA
jgi:hypothetical protein